MSKKAVILLSGGLDSATCAAIAKHSGYELYAMSFSYHQRHNIEVEASKVVAKKIGVKEHKIVSIDLSTFGGSSLTTDLPIPKDGESKDEVPSTYVPARNTIFLSYALAWAEVLGSFDIFIGVTSVDYSGYPDCRPEYIEAYEIMANRATRAGIEGKKLSIHTPLIDLSKASIILEGTKLGFDYSITHSCYDPTKEGVSCGGCDSCIHRHKGFVEAGVDDPTVYLREPKI